MFPFYIGVHVSTLQLNFDFDFEIEIIIIRTTSGIKINKTSNSPDKMEMRNKI